MTLWISFGQGQHICVTVELQMFEHTALLLLLSHSSVLTHTKRERNEEENRKQTLHPTSINVWFYPCLPVSQLTLKPTLCLICVSCSLLGTADWDLARGSNCRNILAWQLCRLPVARLFYLMTSPPSWVSNEEAVEGGTFLWDKLLHFTEALINLENVGPCQEVQHRILDLDFSHFLFFLNTVIQPATDTKVSQERL